MRMVPSWTRAELRERQVEAAVGRSIRSGSPEFAPSRRHAATTFSSEKRPSGRRVLP